MLSPGTGAALPLVPTPAPWLGRSIATAKLRLLEHSAFVEHHSEHESFHNKHLFVHIGPPDHSDPTLEVNIFIVFTDPRDLFNIFFVPNTQKSG